MAMITISSTVHPWPIDSRTFLIYGIAIAWPPALTILHRSATFSSLFRQHRPTAECLIWRFGRTVAGPRRA